MDTAETAFKRPLDGIRVVDMTTYLAGPFSSKMLSDLGAEVIKVEVPAGDPYRNVGPMREHSSIYWLNGNTGKQSVTVDLKDPAGLQKLKNLLASADIFIENTKPQVTRKLGLDQEVISAPIAFLN